jgi:uncharacterized membrane protein
MSSDSRALERRAPVHPSRAAIAGHPIHPMLVPLPIGLLAGAAASDVLFLRTGDRFFARASRWLLAGGIGGALSAAPFGLVDFVSIRAARERPEAWLHAIGNFTVVALAASSLALRSGSDDRRPPGAAVVLSGAGASLLLVTGWLGGELAYRHRIGVAS